jgi:hypothetical protein
MDDRQKWEIERRRTATKADLDAMQHQFGAALAVTQNEIRRDIRAGALDTATLEGVAHNAIHAAQHSRQASFWAKSASSFAVLAAVLGVLNLVAVLGIVLFLIAE